MATGALSEPILNLKRTYGFKINGAANELNFRDDKLYFPGDGELFLGSSNVSLGVSNRVAILEAPPTMTLPVTATSGTPP